MNSTFFTYTGVQRGGLFGFVTGAHVLHTFFTVGKSFVAHRAQIHPMRARLASGEV